MNVIHIKAGTEVAIPFPMTACIGYFDGLHIGHQSLVNEVLTISKQTNTVPALITFEPDPWVIIKKCGPLPHLISMPDRIAIGEAMGIETMIILDFDETMAALDVTSFHRDILNRLSLHTLVCGFDFHYAAKGKGNMETLKQHANFKVSVMKEIQYEHEKISSTRIEQLLEAGNIEKANLLLSRPYEIEGIVVKGNQLGRTIGFPTANLHMEHLYCIPKRGVYVGSVLVDHVEYPAIINIGKNPTFNLQQHLSIEANIINFKEELYGQKLRYRFYQYIREEKKFESKEELMKQLSKDTQTALVFFEERRNEHAS